MYYYFFLKDSVLDSSIALSNFPPTTVNNHQLSDQFVCIATSKHDYWEIKSICQMAPYDQLTLKSTEIIEEKYINSSLVFLSPQKIDGQYPTLPALKKFFSSPAWRSNLKIIGPTTSVSYQGEYPEEMIDKAKGTLVSISGMLQIDDQLINKIFLANFQRSPRQEMAKVHLIDVEDKQIISTFKVTTNQVSLIDLSQLNLNKKPKLSALVSHDILGVPIYFTSSLDYRHFSLEHSHPPIELTGFGAIESRFSLVKDLKNQWLSIGR